MTESQPRHLTPLAEAEIQDLRNAGVEVTDNEVIWINDLCRKVINPPGGSTLPAGTPARAGSSWLWPLTIQAAAWYDRAVQWFDGAGEEIETAVLAYALSHGRTPAAFDLLQDYQSARGPVLEWFRRLDCTHQELTQAVAAVLHTEVEDLRHLVEDKEEEEPAKDGDAGADIVAFLVQHVHGDPEVWQSRTSLQYAMHVASCVVAQAQAEGGHKDPNSPDIVVQRNLGIALMLIKKRHQEAHSG